MSDLDYKAVVHFLDGCVKKVDEMDGAKLLDAIDVLEELYGDY